MKRALSAAALVLVFSGFAAAPSQAGGRWHLGAFLDDRMPPPDAYFFDDGYAHDNFVSENPGIEDESSFQAYPDGQPSLYGYDPNYYEPRFQSPQKRIDRLRAGLRAQAQAQAQKQVTRHAVAKTLEVPASKPRKSATSDVASLQPKTPLESAKPKTQPTAKLVLPTEKPQGASGGVSCEKGATIVKGYGFSDVKPKTCTGDIFAFNAMRSGKAYEILLSSKSGALTEVKRQ